MDAATHISVSERASSAPIRQFEDNSASATPATQVPGGGQLANQPASPQHPPGIIVNIIASLLRDRADAAAILTAVALQLPSSSPSVGATPASQQHVEHPGMQQLMGTPRSVSFVKEQSRSERDAALLERAVDLSTPPITSAGLAESVVNVSPYRHHLPGNTPPPSPPPLITISTIPSNLLTSPSIGIIKQVLEAPIDYTLKAWRSRCFYEPTIVAEYARWSDPSSPPHRDAPEALAILSDFDELYVPPTLLSPHPDTAASAWHLFRGLLLNALHRAFAAGVEWRRALRSLVLLFSDPDGGHPRILSYVERAINDSALVLIPPLHADVLIYQLDVSFAHGSRSHGLHSHSAAWERATSRLPGEDVLTLAHRVVDAYVKKLGGVADSANVWESTLFTDEISERYAKCLFNDESSAERGRAILDEFTCELSLRRGSVTRGTLERADLSCIAIATERLMPVEAAWARADDLVDLSDIDSSSSSTSSSSARPRPTRSRGAGHRERRAAARALAHLACAVCGETQCIC